MTDPFDEKHVQARKAKVAGPLLHYVYELWKHGSDVNVLSPEQWDVLFNLPLNPNCSKRDEEGFTPTQKLWADIFERHQFYMEKDKLHPEAARAQVISDFKLTKEKQQHTLDKVLGRGREDVNKVLRERGLINLPHGRPVG